MASPWNWPTATIILHSKRFSDHFAAVEVQTLSAESSTAWASYKSGDDALETGVATMGDELLLIQPKVNGRPAFLPTGVLRDTTTSIQGNAATIEKLGAVLQGEQGRMKFIQVEPQSGTFVGWNPLPDLAKFSFLIPGGIKIWSDGRIGLARVLINPRRKRVEVTHAWREGQDQDPDAATALILSGFKTPPTVDFNGTVQTNLTTHILDGQLIYLVPLRKGNKALGEIEKALRD